MKPVSAVKNQFRGINPHLHSLWQGKGNWHEFHANHITSLVTTLKAQLLPMGYTAKAEQSLQIRRHDHPTRNPESDVMIFDLDPVRALRTVLPAPAVGERALMMPLISMIAAEESEQRTYKAVGLYEMVNTDTSRGEPVAWIELLSPSNKEQDADVYQSEVFRSLNAGVVIVELDYLHESPPLYANVKDYSKGEAGSFAYHIVVNDPRPTFWQGRSYLRLFHVDEPVPYVVIPLNGPDVIKFDFNIPYQKTFTELLYGIELVDYRQLPINLERYSADDRARIVNRIVVILEAAKRGDDLETVTLEVPTLPLDEALARIEVLNKEAW